MEELQRVVPENGLLVEYYTARNRFYVCLVSRKTFKILPLSDVWAAEEVRLLQLQLSKFRLGNQYTRALEKPLMQATQAHLEELYAFLIAPIRDQLVAEHLIIVPHAFLHYLPFHALSDGKRYLIDDFFISYAPSSSIFAVCQEKKASRDGDTLVLAVPDARAPSYRRRGAVRGVSHGQRAAFHRRRGHRGAVARSWPESRYIHIATHGYFRQDIPCSRPSAWVSLC